MQEYSEDNDIGSGARQGCCISPILFNIYGEAMMTEAMEGIQEGITVEGKMIQDVRFAADLLRALKKDYRKSWISLMQQLRTLE